MSKQRRAAAAALAAPAVASSPATPSPATDAAAPQQNGAAKPPIATPPKRPAPPAPVAFFPSASRPPPRPIFAAVDPPRAPPPPAAASAPPQAEAPPPHFERPAVAVPSAPKERTWNTGAAAENYAAAKRAHDVEGWRRSREVPQGEQGLVHAWIYALTLYPPDALTIWFRRTDPAASAYELYLRGDQLATADYPDRHLYDELRRVRRQPTVAEKFVGRIRGVMPDGAYKELGGGEIALPPEPSQPQTPWAPGPSSPWGGAPPWWGGAGQYAGGASSPWGSPPPWFGSGGGWGGGAPWWAGQAAAPPWAQELMARIHQAGSTPPATIAHDAGLVEMWKTLHQAAVQSMQQTQGGNNELTGKLIDALLANKGRDATPRAEKSAVDSLSDLVKLAGLLDDLRGSGGKGGLTVHDVGGAKIVEDKDGNIEPFSSALLSTIPDAKELLRNRAAARAGGASPFAGGGGNRAPAGRVAAAPPNGRPAPR